MSIKTSCAPSSSALAAFFTRQIEAWPQARDSYRALGEVVTERCLTPFWRLLHNPARAVSSCAKLDAASIAARPCFLCQGARPAEQTALPLEHEGERFHLLVNPFPIFSPHFVVAAEAHTPQRLTPSGLRLMAALALGAPDMCTFYNGPRSGASAPDHLHFQMVPSERLPILRLPLRLLRSLPRQVSVGCPMADALPQFVAVSVPVEGSQSAENSESTESTEAAVQTAMTVMSLMPVAPGAAEPDVNVFVSLSNGRLSIIIVPRSRHRPAAYGPEGILFSPGAIDMAGCAVLPRHSDFIALTQPQLEAYIREVQPSPEQHAALILSIISLPRPE